VAWNGVPQKRTPPFQEAKMKAISTMLLLALMGSLYCLWSEARPPAVEVEPMDAFIAEKLAWLEP
jgi:hypothetical protein